MQSYLIKTNQINDINEKTYTQEQITEKVQLKDQYGQREIKIYDIHFVTEVVAIMVIIKINILIIWFIRHETTKKPLARPCACPFMLEDKWTPPPAQEPLIDTSAP